MEQIDQYERLCKKILKFVRRGRRDLRLLTENNMVYLQRAALLEEFVDSTSEEATTAQLRESRLGHFLTDEPRVNILARIRYDAYSARMEQQFHQYHTESLEFAAAAHRRADLMAERLNINGDRLKCEMVDRGTSPIIFPCEDEPRVSLNIGKVNVGSGVCTPTDSVPLDECPRPSTSVGQETHLSQERYRIDNSTLGDEKLKSHGAPLCLCKSVVTESKKVQTGGSRIRPSSRRR